MGTIYLPDQGEIALLTKQTADTVTCKLYTNDVTSGLSDTQIAALEDTDFTEATSGNFTGYVDVDITGGTWTITGGQPSTATNSEVSFACTADQTALDIYGWYLVDATSGDLLFFNHFDSPVTIEFNGDEITFTPYIYFGKNEDLMPIGTMVPYAGGDYDTTIWGLTDGTAISRTGYPEFFAKQNAIGLPWGVGDGSTTFNKPNLRERIPIGQGASGDTATLAATGGTFDHVHSLAETDSASAFAKLSSSTSGFWVYDQRTTASWTYDVMFDPTGGTKSASSSTSTTAVALGGDTADANPPWVAVPYLIKLR